MSKKFIGISICVTFIFTLMISFTNCTPVHESGESIDLLSTNECAIVFESFYNDYIKDFDSIGSCSNCHRAGGIGDPDFLSSFSEFVRISDNSLSPREQINNATNRILANATEGNSIHNGNDINSAEEEDFRAALNSTNNDFDTCNSEF